MQVKNLKLVNFRNYREAEFKFDKRVIGLFGKNGSGKTNVLDAIHYLAFSKSVLNNQDAQNVCHGENYFFIEGEFEKDGKQNSVRCAYDGKKRLAEDGQEYSRFSEHIGKYPVIMIMPQDINLIWEGGEGRRRFFDLWLSQSNKLYLEKLVEYNQILKQRNSLLRTAQGSGFLDSDLLGSYNQPLALASHFIHQERKTFIERINPLLKDEYTKLIKNGEEVKVAYASHLDSQTAHQLFEENIDKELTAGRTLGGIHLDEYNFLLNNFEVRKYGSQGQQKSFLISLKMSGMNDLSAQKGFSPILLLDDIFDKMDDDRIIRLMEIICNSTGQVFITDANPARARDIFKTATLDFQEFNIGKEI